MGGNPALLPAGTGTKEEGLFLHQKWASIVLFLKPGRTKPLDQSLAIVYYHKGMVPYVDNKHSLGYSIAIWH